MTTTTERPEITVEKTGHIAVVTIDRPPNNHVSVPLMHDLADRLEKIDADGEVRAVVLASAGKAFCAGADLVAPDGIGGSGMSGINDLYTQAVRLFSIETPIIAAVQGAAVGAGLGLALVADFRVASPEARFAANFVKLGFHPGFGLSCTLPRLVGQQMAARLFYLGERIDGERMLQLGLADELAADDQVLARAQAFAQEIALSAPLAVQSTRETLRQDLADQVAAVNAREVVLQREQFATQDFREGVAAATERRAPRFTGR